MMTWQEKYAPSCPVSISDSRLFSLARLPPRRQHIVKIFEEKNRTFEHILKCKYLMFVNYEIAFFPNAV